MKRITLAVALVLCLASCDDIGTQTEVIGVIMPMKIGNEWVYKETAFDSVGQPIAIDYDTVRIARDSSLLGEMWFLDNHGILQTNRQDGRWVFAGTPYMTEKYPARLNDSYVVQDSLSGILARVSGANISVVVPAGAYEAYGYRWSRLTTANAVADFFFVPNIGMVKAATYSRSSTVTYISSERELMSVTIR
jgi:hypothetical protein